MAIYTSNYTKDEIDEGVGLGLASPLNIYKSIVAAICASSIDGFTVTETTNAEWDYVLTDSEDRIIAGVKTDGSLYIADIDSRDMPDDGIRAVTVTSAAAMTVNPDVVTVIDGAVGTAAITLQVPQDNLAHVWDILMTTDSTVAITFAMSNSATILAPSGFSVGASKAVEISVIGVGTKYYLRYGEFA